MESSVWPQFPLNVLSEVSQNGAGYDCAKNTCSNPKLQKGHLIRWYDCADGRFNPPSGRQIATLTKFGQNYLNSF